MPDPATVRGQLADALEIVLPGRIQPYPPTTRRFSAPTIFIEQHLGSPGDDGFVASFPVWVVVDGADRAQLAANDDLVWNALLAVWPIADRASYIPQLIQGFRATVITVEVLLAPDTLCGPPAAATVTIPPTPLTRNNARQGAHHG